MKISGKRNIRVSYAGLSDVGKVRTENEDSYGQFPENSLDSYVSEGLLFLVADGMGGHEKGEVASRMAVQMMAEEYYSSRGVDPGRSLVRSFQTANTAIFQKAKEGSDAHQMGTTLSALALRGNVAHIAHVGDSRIYMVRQDKLVQMTTDHTKVEDLKRAGIINKEEAKKHPERSTLQRALGVKEHVRVDLSSDIRVKADDIFILCTDGLAQVKKDELASIVQNESPHTACQKFIALANERGGGDNSTVQVIKIEKGIQEQRATGKQKIFFQRPLWFGLGILALIFILTMMYISSDYGKIDSRSPAVQFNDSRSEMDEITGLFDRARKYTSRNRYEDAVQAYQEILMINPLDTDALSELDQIAARMIREGEKFDRQGNTGQALRYFRQAYDIRPRDKKLAEIIRKLEQR